MTGIFSFGFPHRLVVSAADLDSCYNNKSGMMACSIEIVVSVIS